MGIISYKLSIQDLGWGHTKKILGFELLITTATHRMGKKVETAHLNGFIKERDCYFQYATMPVLKHDKMQPRYFQLHFTWEKSTL